MSADLSIHDSELTMEQWQDLVSMWADCHKDQLFEKPEFSEGDQPTLFVSGTGSVRGFFLTLGDQTEVHIPALASRSDWHRCYSLLRRAIREGGGTLSHDEGQTYSVEDLSEDSANRDAEKYISFDLRVIASRAAEGSADLRLPTPHFDLAIMPADLELESEQLLDTLAARFARFASAFRPTMKFGGENGEGAAWALIPSIFPRLDWLLIPADGTDDLLELPWSEMERIIGDHMESIGSKGFFLPGKDELGAEKVSALRASAMPRKEPGQQHSEEEKMLHSVLVSAPLAVLLAVAGSDGKVEEEELNAAVEFMTDLVKKDGSAVVRGLFAACVSQLQSILEMLRPETLPQVLATIPGAMDRMLDDEDKALYIDSLVRLMQATACASGGLFGLGSKISRKEKKMIEAIEALLLGIGGPVV